MKEIPSFYYFLATAIILEFVISTIRDKNCRKIKDSLIRQFERKKNKAVYLETKTYWNTKSFLRSRIFSEKAEIIFTEGSIIYFGYSSFFNYRSYRRVKYWHRGGTEIPRQIPKPVLIKNLAINRGNLVINSVEDHIEKRAALQNVVESSQFETIKNMLSITQVNFEKE